MHARALERVTYAAALLIAVAMLDGCASRPRTLYHWGHYQPLLYRMYVKPGTADPTEQVAKLSEDVEKARTAGAQVPPGEHAQLGYMEYLQGHAAEARTQFVIERRLYPESATFVDAIVDKLRAGG